MGKGSESLGQVWQSRRNGRDHRKDLVDWNLSIAGRAKKKGPNGAPLLEAKKDQDFLAGAAVGAPGLAAIGAAAAGAAAVAAGAAVAGGGNTNAPGSAQGGVAVAGLAVLPWLAAFF